MNGLCFFVIELQYFYIRCEFLSLTCIIPKVLYFCEDKNIQSSSGNEILLETSMMVVPIFSIWHSTWLLCICKWNALTCTRKRSVAVHFASRIFAVRDAFEADEPIVALNSWTWGQVTCIADTTQRNLNCPVKPGFRLLFCYRSWIANRKVTKRIKKDE